MILHTRGRPSGFSGNVLGRITRISIPDMGQRRDYIFAADALNGSDVRGYAGVLASCELDFATLERLSKAGIPVVHAVRMFEIFEAGQVVNMEGRTGFIRILFRPGSRFNYILATDRCNSRCLMCSQPPKDIDDSTRVREHIRLVELIEPSIPFLGITGGEPTLLKDGFLALIAKCRDRLPKTHIHVLTNGRLFYYESFVRNLAEVAHPALTLGIPLYSDIDWEHDYVVQAQGAFLQTVVGLHNLAKYGVTVEVRVVLHALTYKRLPQLAEYIYRNFPFVSHVALMGLELTGYTKPNLSILWVDPFDYQDELEGAVSILSNRKMRVSIYNHQLCVLRRSLWPFARQAISDWKNVYIDECSECLLQDKCGGFFASGTQLHSAHVKAFRGTKLQNTLATINSE